MTKNTKTYVLLGAVLLIWGVVGYKIFSGLSPEEMVQGTTEKVSFKPKTYAKKDSFSIVANYRDPFLGTLPKQKKPRKKKVVKKEKVPEIQISYTGSIINNDKNSSIFFLTIAGNQVLLKPKASSNGVTLLSGNEQQVRVKHKGKLRTISLQQ